MKYIFVLLLPFLACTPEMNHPTDTVTESTTPKGIEAKAAQNLLVMPLNCVTVEYPNKLGQTIGGYKDLKSPKELHPSFYGCFDWHSAVHGHWSIVRLLKRFPDLADRDKAINFLQSHITSENIEVEVAYFKGKHNKSYERMYGWAWLLKLAEELHTWDTPEAQEMSTILQPLTDIIISGYVEYLPKLNYPIRVGTHTNTAFGLSFAHDYAISVENKNLQVIIEGRAKDFYMQDADCPITWEPSGHDFLSPCLEEANLMGRILKPADYEKWLTAFLPQLSNPKYSLEPGIVSDRSDGHLVHLDGVNFSRAWCLYGIAKRLPKYEHLNDIAEQHIGHSLNDVVGDDYEGGHWLGSFAIYALGERGD
ncbi:MAG: hypothetical protein ACJA01_004321 [Saprospiraceae bacterium]|jgi:hypothetical protein